MPMNREPRAFEQRKRLIVVRIAAVAAVALLLFTRPFLSDGSEGHEVLELLGLTLVVVCVGGRLWSILYIGGSKKRELISIGPFSMTQNPLYFFSTVGAVGIGLIYGSAEAALLLGFVTFTIFRVTARKEAEFLLSNFGSSYSTYALRTPKFWPDPILYRDEKELYFSTHALKRTFYDGLFFLAIFPVIEICEYIRDTSTLPVLLTLY
ncbi:sodium:proton antiporter [Mesorhizobium loti NZP2037]|nr:sodium:proton antiporter [Mesorhizobium loti NZP2037]